MQKLCCVRTRQHPLPVWSHKFVLSSPTHISVWEKLSQLCREETFWTYVKAHVKSQDGCAAYMSLKQHHLGPNNVNHMANKAENRIRSLSYTGEKCNWNFKTYTNELTSQFSIIEDLHENHGHVGIDKQSKVRYLMDGIKMDTLDPVRMKILADAELAIDCVQCICLYLDFIGEIKGEGKGVQIAAFSSEQEVEPDMYVKDCYYTYKEFQQLSPAQKARLKHK